MHGFSQAAPWWCPGNFQHTPQGCAWPKNEQQDFLRPKVIGNALGILRLVLVWESSVAGCKATPPTPTPTPSPSPSPTPTPQGGGWKNDRLKTFMPRVKGKCDMNSENGLGFAFLSHHRLWEPTPTPTHTPIPQGGGWTK